MIDQAEELEMFGRQSWTIENKDETRKSKNTKQSTI